MEEYTVTLLKVLLNEHYYSVLVSDEKTMSSEVGQAYRKAMLTTEKFLDKVIEENGLEVDSGRFPKIERANVALVFLKPKVKMDVIKNRGKISILLAKRNFNLFSKLIFEHMFNLESLTTLEACKNEGLTSENEVTQAVIMWRMRGLDEQVANVSREIIIAKSLIEQVNDPVVNKIVAQTQTLMKNKLQSE